MSTQKGYVKASRAAFFIFNPDLQPDARKPSEEEIADAKIIYYSPSYASAEEKRSQTGLLEGLISFTQQFSGEKGPLRNMRTKQLSFSVLECETSTWMVLVMRHPQSQREVTKGVSETKFEEEALDDNTLQAVLKNCYSVFRLLHGEIKYFIKEHSMQKLFDLLEDFVPAFIETIDAGDLGIFHEIDGFHYGPVERNTCVSIHCFLNRLQEQFPSIRHAALLYNAHLIYSGFSLNDMKALYSYLVSYNGAVSNMKLNKVPFGRIPTAASQPGGGSSSFGRAFLLQEEEDYLFGLSNKSSHPASLFVPTVYLTNGGPGKLVALIYQGIMLILIFEPEAQLDTKILEMVRASCTTPSNDGLSLCELRPLIASQYAHVMEHDDEYRFVYYNHANHAFRLSNQSGASRSLLGGSRSGSTGLKPTERGLLCPLHATLEDPWLKCREASWKSADRGWICAKKSFEREFYLLLDNSSMSLSKCQEECARFAQIHFSNIFMM